MINARTRPLLHFHSKESTVFLVVLLVFPLELNPGKLSKERTEGRAEEQSPQAACCSLSCIGIYDTAVGEQPL